MNKLYLVNRDTVMSKSGNKFVPFLFEFQKPAEYLRDNHGAIICSQSEFFNGISETLTEDDVAIIFISVKNEEYIKKLANCKAQKLLRVIDPSKSDKVLFKEPLELHSKVNFSGFIICYHNEDHIKYLFEKHNVDSITWPHSLDFSNAPENHSYTKTGVWISAGQQHEKFYPCRWNLTKILNEEFHSEGVILPHPGYDIDNLMHPYVGEKFLNFISDFVFMPVGVGINDGFHMKFIEAAWANVLPIGTVPSYVPEYAKKCIPLSNMDPSNYNKEEVVSEIKKLLNEPELLVAHIRDWRLFCKTFYDLEVVQENFMHSLKGIVK